MAKKRTKAAKIKAAARLHDQAIHESAPQTLTPSLPVKTGGPKLVLPSFVTPTQRQSSQQLWRFDPTLIYQDLFKTALASGLIVGILVLIYWLSF